jgi:uncharacterized phage protein (TIGR02220 family)
MSKLQDNNYISIQAFMVKDLHLKGNELIIYAAIFGFSQTENQTFTGSLQYLADWTNSTKQGVIKCLKGLQAKGLIAKTEKYINGVKFCEYHATQFNRALNTVEHGVLNTVEQGIKQSLPNNISDNINADNKNNNIASVVAYLNEKAGTSYRASSKATARHIEARLNEGYTLKDFFAVIDKKVAEWKGGEMEKYLRPETLFGSKFEGYLNARVTLNRRGANGVLMDDRTADELDAIF